MADFGCKSKSFFLYEDYEIFMFYNTKPSFHHGFFKKLSCLKVSGSIRIEMFEYWYRKHSKWKTSSRVSQVQMSAFVPWTIILICCSCKSSPWTFSWRSLVIWCGTAQEQKVLHSCLHRAAQWPVAQWPVPIKMAGWGSPPDCILTEEGISFWLWSPACNLETPSRTTRQCDVFSNDQVNLEGPRCKICRGQLTASQGWLSPYLSKS